MLLQIETRKVEPDITVIQISGRIALGRESQQIEKLVQDLIAAGVKKLIFDLTNVSYIDSTGIGIIAFSGGRTKKAGGDVRIAGATGIVLKALKISLMDTVLQLFPTAEDAAAGF